MADDKDGDWRKGLNPAERIADQQATPASLRRQEGEAEGNPAADTDDVASQEAAGNSNAPGRKMGKVENFVGGAMGGAGAAGFAGTVFNFILGHQGSSTTVAGIIIALVFMIGSIATPAGILVFIKESLSKWAHHFPEISTSRRIIKVGQARYFDFPECKGSKFKCRHHKGISKSEAERFKKAGIELKDPYKKGNKTFYKEMVFTDADGTRHTVTGATFEEFMRKNPVFRARMNKIITSRSVLTRSSTVVKNLFKRLNINRKNPAGEENDTRESRLKKIRNYFYGQVDKLKAHLRSTEVPDTDEDGNPRPNADRANQTYGATQQDVDELNERARSGRMLPGDIPSARGLLRSSGSALKNLAEKATGVTKSALGGLFKGIFTSISAYCTTYQLVRVIAFTSKVIMAAQLIQFVMLYLTETDRVKEGEGGAGNIVSFLAGTLLEPSKEEGSEGKTFADSSGWLLVSQGAVVDREAMIRFATGGMAMILFGRIKKMMELGGAVSPAFCKHLNAWYGQAGVIVGGVISSFLTGFGGAVAGVLTGAASYLMTAAVMKYALPVLLAMAAGAVIPDMANDPAGGFGKGNAMGAGMAALGDWSAQAAAIRPANEGELSRIQKENFIDIQTQIAAENINNREKGIFSRDNPMSFQNQMAGALLPYTSSIFATKNAASMILDGGSLIQNAFATIPNMFSRTAGAINDVSPESVKYYRGEACPDEGLVALQYARTGTCAAIRADTGPYREFSVIKEDLEKQGYIENEQPNDEMTKYHEVCHVPGEYPNDPSGLNIDGTNSDGKMCFSKAEKYRLFDEYYQSDVIDESFDEVGEGRHGLENPGKAYSL